MAASCFGTCVPFARKQADRTFGRPARAASLAGAAAKNLKNGLHTPAAGAAVASSRAGPGRALSPPMQSITSFIPRARAMPSLFVAATIATTVLFAGTGAAFSSNGASRAEPSKSVLGQDLEMCSTDPLTGYFRNGYCETGPSDLGTHTVCAKVTSEFLEYTLQQGNDLVTPRPEYRFPGLKPGDGWCLCASRWHEAMEAGVAPPIVLGATHEKTLRYVDMVSLQKHAAQPGSSSE